MTPSEMIKTNPDPFNRRGMGFFDLLVLDRLYMRKEENNLQRLPRFRDINSFWR